jgi:hypothetical protein
MTHFYPFAAYQRLSQRGSQEWLAFMEKLAQMGPTALEMIALTQTMRTLRDSLGLGAWLLQDPSNAMDINFVLDCYKGDEQTLFEVYSAHLDALRPAEDEVA